MTPSSNELAHAFSLLKQKKIGHAEEICRRVLSQAPGNAAAVHLLGLVRKEAGDLAEAHRLLQTSVELQPGNAEFRTNLANLMVRLGRLSEAETCYRAALSLHPGRAAARLGLARTLNALKRWREAELECRSLLEANAGQAEAWSALAAALRGQDRLVEAEAALRRAISIAPRYAAAHLNLGSLLSQSERAEEALSSLQQAHTFGVRGFEAAFNRGRTLLQLYRIEEAEQAFAEAVDCKPRDTAAQLSLMRVRFMRGDPQFARTLEAVIAESPDDAALQILLGDVLRRTGDLPSAERVLRDLLARTGPLALVRSALAAVLHEAGRLQEAQIEARAAATMNPQDPGVLATLVAVLLSLGDAAGAAPFIHEQRSVRPDDQRWIAYEATAARLLDLPLYRELYDYDRFVRNIELEPPHGWSSMQELNEALLRALNARHGFVQHPLDQSLRHGSQTARSLLTESDPAITAVLTAFNQAIETYRGWIGADPSHPFTARNRGTVALSGCWSVQLRRDGYHVNHVHPEGWLSSAYYVSTPAEIEDVSLKSGWLKLGEPRFPVPGAAPARFIKPRAGLLVLFPSYMWHGTNRIHGDEPRTTIAFDAVPRS